MYLLVCLVFAEVHVIYTTMAHASSMFSPSHPASPQLVASSGPLDLCPPPRCTGTVVQPYTVMPCL